MRALEKALFVFGVAAFVASAAAAGSMLGDILWRAGIAVMLTDLLLMKLWPEPERPEVERQPVATGG